MIPKRILLTTFICTLILIASGQNDKKQVYNNLPKERIAKQSISAQQPVFSYGSNGTIIANTQYVGSFYNEAWNDITPYIPRKEVSVNTNTGTHYTVRLLKYNHWENEPGDYTVIEIRYKNNTILTITDGDGWDYFYTEKDTATQQKPVYILPMPNGCTFIIFTGITITSQPPFFTVVALKNGEAKLVYNRRSYINDITRSGNSTIFHLQENTLEYSVSDKIPDNSPILHTLTFKDGMIYYQ